MPGRSGCLAGWLGVLPWMMMIFVCDWLRARSVRLGLSRTVLCGFVERMVR